MNLIRKAEKPLHRSRDSLEETSLGKDILFLFLKIIGIAVVFVLTFTFLYGLHQNVDESMEPSLRAGDIIVYYRLNKDYVAQDVILLDYGGVRQTRRVIAVAGDTVDITEEGLVINGALQQERNIYQKTQRYEEGVTFPLTVGEGEVFVLADARDNATDSRIYGTVKVQDSLGRVFTVLRRRNI